MARPGRVGGRSDGQASCVPRIARIAVVATRNRRNSSAAAAAKYRLLSRGNRTCRRVQKKAFFLRKIISKKN